MKKIISIIVAFVIMTCISYSAVSSWGLTSWSDSAELIPFQSNANKKVFGWRVRPLEQGVNKIAVEKEVSIDATDASAIEFDIQSEWGGVLVSVALITGKHKIYYETIDYLVVATSGTKLVFNLKEPTFKTAQSQWENNATLHSKNDIGKIVIIIRGELRAGYTTVKQINLRMNSGEVKPLQTGG